MSSYVPWQRGPLRTQLQWGASPFHREFLLTQKGLLIDQAQSPSSHSKRQVLLGLNSGRHHPLLHDPFTLHQRAEWLWMALRTQALK